MSHRLKVPLNPKKVGEADDQFYANHPELVQNGRRIPLDARDPAQASLRKEWVGLYRIKSHEVKGSGPSKKKPATAIEECPACSEKQGLLIVNVVDQSGFPVKGALVSVDLLNIRTTDAMGVADFGAVEAKSYRIAASKDKFYPYGPYSDTVEVQPQEKTTATLGLAPCIAHTLAGRRKIAEAKQTIDSKRRFPIPDSAGGPIMLDFGQDITYGTGAALPSGYSEGSDEDRLKSKMKWLVMQFGDSDGMAQREYDFFLKKQSTVTIYTDSALDKSIAEDENFLDFSDRTLAAPGTKGTNPAKIRVHQALANADWDINKVTLISDLGPPAFNSGNRVLSTQDWGNGLAAMVDAVAYVLVFVDKYEYDSCKQQYTITLIFELYDVFGLDDDDVASKGDNHWYSPLASEAVSAWWQLQHQFNYAPMVTKAVVTRTFTVSTAIK